MGNFIIDKSAVNIHISSLKWKKMKEIGHEFVSRQMWSNVSGTRKEGKSVNMVISPGSAKTLNICSAEEKQMCCGQEQPGNQATTLTALMNL